MTQSQADTRCLSCGQLCAAPANGELFRCGRCWTVLQAGACPQGHAIAWPVKSPEAACIYCSGKASLAESPKGAARLVGALRKQGR